MNKAILVLFVLSVALFSGCAQEPTDNGTANLDNGSGTISDSTSVGPSAEELDSLDAELEELESLLADPAFDEIDFLEVNADTFE